MMSQRSNPQGDEDNAENNACAGIELDEQAKKMKTEKKDERTGDRSERIAILLQEDADGAGGCSKRDKDNGKTGNESERGAQKPGARNFAFAGRLQANAGGHGDDACRRGQ